MAGRRSHQSCSRRVCCGLDPVSWTSSERWIRCSQWRKREPNGLVSGSRMNSSSKQCACCSMKARASRSWRASSISSRRRWAIQAGAGRSIVEGTHGPYDRRARGAGAAPQSAPDRGRRARHPKKSHGVLREEPMRFAFIATKRVFYNQRRRHSTLGQISPAAFERRAAA